MKYLTYDGPLSIELMTDGQLLREYHHDGKTYVAGEEGQEYSISLWNETSNRVAAVVRVDGMNIIQGTKYAEDEGYIIPEKNGLKPIPGFLIDARTAARFIFGAPEKSLASLRQKPDEIGRIRATFLKERPQYSDPFWDGAVARGSSASLGTIAGAATDFRTYDSHFERDEDAVQAELVIRYHTRNKLAELGIDLEKPLDPNIDYYYNYRGLQESYAPWRTKRKR